MLKWFQEVGTKLSSLGLWPSLSDDDDPKLFELKKQVGLLVRMPPNRITIRQVFYEDGAMWAKVEFTKRGLIYQSEVELE